MSIASLQQTLTAVGAHQVSGEVLSNPLSKTFDKMLNVITLGIYGAYKSSVATDMKNDFLDLGKALLRWDPACPGVSVQLALHGEKYEISNMPDGGLRLLDCASGQEKEIAGVSLHSLRNMIFSDLINNPDFSKAMERRIYDDTTVHVDFIGMKQERANACGEASMNMILAYHGIDYAPATNSRGVLEGNSKEELLDQMRGNNLYSTPLVAKNNEYTCEQLEDGLKKGPLLCELAGHFVVVHGVNALLDRVDIYCPLLGSRSARLSDFNAHLEWDQKENEFPLMHFAKIFDSGPEAHKGFGKNTDEGFSPSTIDRMGVSVLKGGYALGNSWLQAPEDFSRER